VNEPLPAPLPIKVKPRPGEHYTSYIRRLAQANHLRPSLLRAYVNTDAYAAKGFRIDRLAALASRPVAALEHALTGLPKLRSPGTSPARSKRSYPKRKIPRTPDERLAQDLKLAQEHVRFEDEMNLYARIRADRDLIIGISIDRLAEIYMLSREAVREILDGIPPRPPGRRRTPRPYAALGPVRGLIHQMWRDGMSIDQIWSELLDKHEGTMSKNTLKIYIRALRHGAIRDP
jgi:hypothetical protein